MSQESRILSHLKRGPITPLQALNKFGCLRLAARVHRLREKGHPIEARTVERGGAMVAQYYLEPKKGPRL